MTSWIEGRAGARSTVNGLGDLQLTGRVLLYRERGFAPHHLLWATLGLKFPTAPRIRDDAGFPYSDDDQPGSGSWDPIGGVTYAWMSGGLASVFASTTYRFTTPNARKYRRGSELSWSAIVQLQPWQKVAFAAGIDGNWNRPDTLANDVAASNTGGVALYATPSVLLTPLRSLLVRAAVSVPFFASFNGHQNVGTQVALSVAYDFR